MTIIMVWMVATPYWVKDLRLVANRMVPTRLKLISLAEFVDMISLMICTKEGGGRDQGAICAYMAAVELSPLFLGYHHGEITHCGNTKTPSDGF